jgi:RNA polymerase sigma-70 factor (ECF subfamily)
MAERRAIERLKRGDIGGLEALVRAHQTRALRVAYLVTRDSALAEDVVQHSFLRAYERIGGFDAERPFGPWFLRSVVNEAVKAASRRERLVPLEQAADDESILADPGYRTDDLAERAEIRRKVWESLGKLPPAQRAVVVQRYYLGMSEAEMAEAGDAPPGTIKWRLHAARQRLSRMLRQWSPAQAAPPTRKRSAPVGVSPDTPQGDNTHD